MEGFYTISSCKEAEITEKKSKFIATCIPICSVEEAEKALQRIKTEYKDARHHCYAYRIRKEEQTIEKCSDDGEPSLTAGVPLLLLLQKRELENVILIVTRYFGGILLGTRVTY